MNPSRSIYQTDYTPNEWCENNFSSTTVEFCSSNNIDDCLKYIAQELNALGYPSIYSIPSSYPCEVNCDIVKLLNVVFDLLKGFKEHKTNKEEFEDRNQRLLCDLNALRKKNTQLNERLEQTVRKYNSALETERQLKNKIDHLQGLVKAEKDESKKLASQIQNQKVTHQHELRKNENRFAQMKTRLNQMLAVKNPEKRIVNISTSHSLQKSSNEGGKCKTDSSAKSSSEEMNKSVISNYANQYQAAIKQIHEYQHCLEAIEHQLHEIISIVVDDSYKKSIPLLKTIFNAANHQQILSERFNFTLLRIKEVFLNKVSVNKILFEEVQYLKNKLCIYEDIECKVSTKEDKLETQKLEVLKVGIRHTSSLQPHCSKSLPSFSVTTKNALPEVPFAHELKQSFSSTDEMVKPLQPLCEADFLKSENNSIYASPFSLSDLCYFSSSKISRNFSDSNELPKWARTTIDTPNVIQLQSSGESLSSPEKSNILIEKGILREDTEPSDLQSSEENDLEKLKAAVEDIENRRNSYS